MTADVFLRTIPDMLVQGVKLETHVVEGSIIREIATGRIAGLLQGTSATHRLATALADAGPASGAGEMASLIAVASPLKATGTVAKLAGQAAIYHQNRQIMAAVETVRHLQFANLLVTGAGIGVSVAGFAMLKAQIARMERTVVTVGDRLDDVTRTIDALHRDSMAIEFADLSTVAEQYDEAWLTADGVARWRILAGDAHRLAKRFEMRATNLLERPASVFAAVGLLVDAVALAASLRVNALLAAGDDAPARSATASAAEALSRIVEGIDVSGIALARAGDTTVATRSWTEQISEAFANTRAEIAPGRAHASAAISVALTLDELARQGITGRSWLEAARAEDQHPFLFLPTLAP